MDGAVLKGCHIKCGNYEPRIKACLTCIKHSIDVGFYGHYGICPLNQSIPEGRKRERSNTKEEEEETEKGNMASCARNQILATLFSEIHRAIY
jgi:hypothetical protein